MENNVEPQPCVDALEPLRWSDERDSGDRHRGFSLERKLVQVSILYNMERRYVGFDKTTFQCGGAVSVNCQATREKRF